LDFGCIAEQFEKKADERKARNKKHKDPFKEQDEKAQELLRWFRSLEGSKPRWKSWWKVCTGYVFQWPEIEEPKLKDLSNLVKRHFPLRSNVKILLTDFEQFNATTYEVKLTDIHKYWNEKPAHVQLRWIHVPLGLGPLHSSVEEQFIYAGREDSERRPFSHANRPEWPYPVVEVLNFRDRMQLQDMRDVHHFFHDNKKLTEMLDRDCWADFGSEAHERTTGLLWDLKWRTTHLGLKKDESGKDWETLPDFWSVCHSDVSLQLNEGSHKIAYGPFDALRPKLWQSDNQSLHGHDFFGNAQLVRDPLRFFHREGAYMSRCRSHFIWALD